MTSNSFDRIEVRGMRIVLEMVQSVAAFTQPN